MGVRSCGCGNVVCESGHWSGTSDWSGVCGQVEMFVLFLCTLSISGEGKSHQLQRLLDISKTEKLKFETGRRGFEVM